MGKPIADDELWRIRERCEAATIGPWKASVEGRDHTSASDVIFTGRPEVGVEVAGGSAADYDFIASARQDVPRLLDEVARLRRLASNALTGDV